MPKLQKNAKCVYAVALNWGRKIKVNYISTITNSLLAPGTSVIILSPSLLYLSMLCRNYSVLHKEFRPPI